MTDQPESLAAALVALQARLPKIGKDKTARVVTKDKGTYAYDYANLTTISAKILPLMSSLGLSFTCAPTLQDGRFVLSYRLGHILDEEIIGGFYPLPDPERTTPQAVGSAITYARRYCLCAVTGVAPDGDDDDAQAASVPPARRRAPGGPPPERSAGNLPRNRDGSVSRSQTTDAELNAAGLMDSGQQSEHTALRRGADGRLPAVERGKIEHGPAGDDPWLDVGPEPLRMPVAAQNPAQVIVMHFNRLGFAADERQQRLNIIAALAGRESVTSTNDLTVAEGIRVKAALEKCRDRGALVELMAAGGTGE